MEPNTASDPSARTDADDVAGPPMRPEVHALLRATALLNGVDPAVADDVAARGMVRINDHVMSVGSLERLPGVVNNDILVICPLHGAVLQSTEQAVKLLSLNLTLSGSVGCFVAATDGGELQLLQAMRLEGLEPQIFSNMLTGIAMMAAVMQDNILAPEAQRTPEAAPVTGAGR